MVVYRSEKKKKERQCSGKNKSYGNALNKRFPCENKSHSFDCDLRCNMKILFYLFWFME